MDVRVYIPEEAAVVTLTVAPEAPATPATLETSLCGYQLHPAANELYDFIALRG